MRGSTDMASMHSANVTESVNVNGGHFAGSVDQASYGSGGSSTPHQHHNYHALRQHASGSLSPPPRSQSPPSTAAKQLQHTHQHSPLFPPHQEGRALSTSQPGSPNTYRVSPITYEHGNEASVFNPQSPYRSMAPSQSRFFDSSAPSSPNEQLTRNMGPDSATSSPPRFKRVITSPPSSTSLPASEMQYASQHHAHTIAASDAAQTFTTADAGFTAVLTNTNSQHTTNSPQCGSHFRSGGAAAVPTPEMYSPYAAHRSTQGGPLTSPPTPDSGRSGGGGRIRFPAQRSNEGWPTYQQQQQQQQQQQSQSSSVGEARHGAAPRMTGVGTSASSPVVFAAGSPPRTASPNSSASLPSAADVATILPRKHLENISPAINSSLEGRLPTSQAYMPAETVALRQARAASTGIAPAQCSQLREGVTGSPASPPHASAVAVTTSSVQRASSPLVGPAVLGRHATPSGDGANASRASESAGRWVSPQRPHRATSAEISDGFQSPGSVPSPRETPTASTSAPPPPPPRSPAMYGVIGLPYTRADASATASVSSSRSSNAGKPSTTSAATQFHAAPSPSRAPVTVSLHRPHSQSQQQGDQRAEVQQSSVGTRIASARHADPASSTVGASSDAPTSTPVTAHPRSGSSEFSTRYRRSIAHTTQGKAANASGTRDNLPTEAPSRAPAAITTTTTTTPPPPTPPLQPQQHSSPHDEMNARERDGTVQNEQQQQQQHITSVAPAAVVAARGRVSVNKAAAASPVIATVLVDAAQGPESRPARAAINGSATAAVGRNGTQLTADIVLPVAAQEEEARYSSSTTDTTERSSSNSRRQATTPSPTSSKSSVLTAPTPLASARAKKLSQTANDLSSSMASQRRVSTKQLPKRQSPLSATHSGSSSSSSPTGARVTAVSASSERNARPTTSSSSGSSAPRRTSVSSTSVNSAKSAAPALASYSFVSSRAHLQRYIDQWRDRFEEDKSAYKEGGYLTVTPGKIVHARYVLIQKLGWGEFSTVWLAYDTKHATLGRGATQAFVAVKVAKCRSSVQEATHYEVSLLRYVEARLPPYAAVTNIIDCFEVQGEFGMHTCMVMPLCGPNLLSIIDRVKGQRGRRSAEDVRLVKEIIISVLISLHELSVLNVVHTDIKPENVLCSAVDTKLVSSMEKFCSYNKDRSHMISTEEFRDAMTQQTSDHLVCLADFGLSALLEPPGSAATWTTLCPNLKPSLLAPLMRCKKNFNVAKSGVMENLRGTLIQTREYRAPEVLLGLDFTCATDVWSVGCMAFELITGSFLMDPKKKTRDAREMDVEHLAMMMQLIGPLTPEITNIRVRNNAYYEALIAGTPLPRGTARPPPEYLHRFVDKEGHFIYASRYRAYPRRSLEMELEPFLGFREARLAANFILSCLCSYDPKCRPSAKKLLGHPWFQGLGTPSKEKSGFR